MIAAWFVGLPVASMMPPASRQRKRFFWLAFSGGSGFNPSQPHGNPMPNPPTPTPPPIARFQRVRVDRFPFAGFWNYASACALELLPRPDGRVVVIASELADNPGTSVTNAAELLATDVCRRFGIAPDRLVWIEHYEYGRDAGIPRTFDLVTFHPPRPARQAPPASAALGTTMERGDAAIEKLFANPTWHRMQAQDWEALGLPTRPAVHYDMREF